MDVPVVSDAKIALERLVEWAEAKNTDKWLAKIGMWQEENPLEMRRDHGLSPQMIMEAINDTFPQGIVVTDVGQHQMWATQYITMPRGKQMITSGGLGTMGFGFPAAVGAKIGAPDQGYCLYYGRRRHADEHAGNGDRYLRKSATDHLYFE